MGLIIGIIVAVCSVLVAGLFMLSGMMSDNPSAQGPSPFGPLLIGGLIFGVLIFTHYHPIGW